MKFKKVYVLVSAISFLSFGTACSKDKKPKVTVPPVAAGIDSAKGLKDYYKNHFPVGVAVAPSSLTGAQAELIKREFNSLTAENVMKPGLIHPKENEYYWSDADAIVNFATANKMKARGHTLVWHQQTPEWIFIDDKGDTVSKDVLLSRLKKHIETVVGRYKGKIYAWDVVNEAIDDNNALDYRQTVWYKICGEDFIIKAFEWAHAADPEAVLFYNDYSIERPGKRKRTLKFLKKMLALNVPINGVGIQGHWTIHDNNLEKDLRESIRLFSDLGLKVQITELDMSIHKWDDPASVPSSPSAFTAAVEQKQIEQFKKVFQVLRENKSVITGLTFWNVTDKKSWLDNFPVKGRKDYPLLFDQNLKRKKAYWEVVKF